MKKLALFVVGVCLSLQALAKDGPFPIYNSEGTWQAVDKSVRVRIDVIKPITQNAAVVKLVLHKIDRRIMASGVVTFRGVKETLQATLIYPDGKHLGLTLRPEYKILSNGDKVLHLYMETIELDSPGHQVVPSSLIRISN